MKEKRYIKLNVFMLVCAVLIIVAEFSGCASQEVLPAYTDNSAYYREDESGSELEDEPYEQSNGLSSEEIKQLIADALISSNIEGSSVSDYASFTAFDILTYMFVNYDISVSETEGSPNQYTVEISGNALLNPELREYADMDGVTTSTFMSFTVDIEDGSVVLRSDPDNLCMLYFANYC